MRILLATLKKYYGNYKYSACFVNFKIIDEKVDNVFILQCINSKSTFNAHLIEIVSDHNILHGLHPLQACFIGIEYSKYNLAYKNINIFVSKMKKTEMKYSIKYIDRVNFICYIDNVTREEKLICPKELAFTDNLISDFSSEHSFLIGYYAGKKIHNLNNVFPIKVKKYND